MKPVFLTILFSFLCFGLYAQNGLTLSTLTVNDGLSQGMIFDILQSKDGFIWIATKDGLNRYDGSRFEVFSPDPFNPYAIGGSEVQALFEDSRGWLWISLPDGVDVYEPGSGYFFHLKFNKRSIPSQYIAETADGAIWLSNLDEIIKILPKKEQLQEAVQLKSANIEVAYKPIAMKNAGGWTGNPLMAFDLHYTKGKKLIIGTNHGLFSLDPSTEKIIPEIPNKDEQIKYISENSAGEILLKSDQNGSLFWTLLSNGKVTRKNSAESYISIGRHLLDDKGSVWTIQNKHLLKWKLSALFAGGNPEWKIAPGQFNLDDNEGFEYNSLMADRSGIVWAGTTGFGIVRLNERGQKFKTYLPRTGHRLILEDQDGALYTPLQPNKKFLQKNFDISAPNTGFPIAECGGKRSLVYDRDGNIWWLSDKIYRKDAVTQVVTHWPIEGDGLAMICDRNGKLISVSEKGLHRFDPITKSRQDFPFDRPRLRKIIDSYFLHEDITGNLWIFGLEGLIKASPGKNGYAYRYFVNKPTDPTSLSINTVLCAVDDPLEAARYLWLGTKGGGLNRLDKTSGKFQKFSKEQGLPDNVIYGILSEDKAQNGTASSYLWMSTNKGLCRFDVRTQTTKIFTVKDGLQDNEFNGNGHLKTRDGHLIFCGVNGINVFHPAKLHFNEILPQIQIVGLQVNNKKMNPVGKSSIELAADQNLLNFEFAALEFTNSSQNQYRYQLLGLDDKWVDLGFKNNIQFANLAPGHYTFKVAGSNNDGLWSKDVAELKFTIKSPWYASWWAYGLYLILAGLAIRTFYNYKIRERLKYQETAKLREIDEFKSRFFTNITHEFRTPLTVILGISGQMVKEQKDPVLGKKIELIKRNGDNLLRLVNQILDLSKLESQTLQLHYTQGDVLAYLKYISESLHSVANSQNLLLKIESDQARIEMDYDADRLLQIMYNLLSNAIKFTPSGGKVILRANQVNDRLHIGVEDTGPGIPEEEMVQIFDRFFQAKNQQHAKAGGTGIGLSLTKELVKLMGGDIKVESQPGVGTKFLITLPITKNAPKENDLKNEDVRFDTLSPSRPAGDLLTNPISSATEPTLLLIEDNPDVVEYLSACLQSHFQLDFAFNGQAGIEKALETLPDIIISDVMMPIKDGFDVLAALKSDEKTSHIPIVLLTARADIQSKLTGLRKGADAYLAKPFHQEELIVTVENLLELRKQLQLKYQQNHWITTEVKEAPAEDIEDVFLQKFRSVVEENISNADFEMPHLERALSMSRSQIYRKIKALTDKSPSMLIRSIRLNRGRQMLLTTQLTVSEIAYEVGYNALNNFSDAYLEEFGERPLKTRG